jgi:hypothetical protein
MTEAEPRPEGSTSATFIGHLIDHNTLFVSYHGKSDGGDLLRTFETVLYRSKTQDVPTKEASQMPRPLPPQPWGEATNSG